MAKALIVYSSQTGNTERVAGWLSAALKLFHWDVDQRKIDNSWKEEPPINFARYQLLVAGSAVHWSLPLPWLVELFRSQEIPSGKIIPGPRCGVAFATYGGVHLGPREADPCLTCIELLFEHLGYQSSGRLAIPGKMGDAIHPEYYHSDLPLRPNIMDKQAVDNFIEKLHRKQIVTALMQ